MSKPQPENYKTAAEYRWALRNWRRRTGGSLVGTAAVALIVGAWALGATGAIILAVLAVLVHVWLRQR